jgi:two-component sensor histidine kinase/CheY-like chemotaxis protein
MDDPEKPFAFKPEDGSAEKSGENRRWKIVIADDDAEVHAVTRLALEDFSFEGNGIEFLSAYSGKETEVLVRENPDTALVLLDIVMEEEDTGLRLVEYIRRIIGNTLVRIILRTGQPGQAPEMDVIRNFDINDYKEKIELTDKKLHTAIVSSLRSYRDLLQIERNRKDLEASLREKEILLHEVHHRVKNNLQVISSLLSMQADQITETRILSMFKESRDRIRSMALIHEKLYQSGNFEEIDFTEYLDTMTAELFSLYGMAGRVHRIFSCTRILLDLDRAVPCGLLVNELVTNALKYAFPDNRSGTIYLELSEPEPDRIALVVGDNGIGLPESIDHRNAATMGLQLVSILARQVDGDVTLSRERGTRFSILFRRHRVVPELAEEPAETRAADHSRPR